MLKPVEAWRASLFDGISVTGQLVCLCILLKFSYLYMNHSPVIFHQITGLFC